MQKYRGLLKTFFPAQQIYTNKWTWQQQLWIFGITAMVFYAAGWFIVPNGFFGFDWYHFYGKGVVPVFYPPWNTLLVQIGWPLTLSLSLGGIALAVFKRSVHGVSAIAALLTLPLFWTLFLGQLDGLVVFGLLGLPWLVPIVLAKPQVSVFALGARPSYLAAGVIWLLISFAIWGFWPEQMFIYNSFQPSGRFIHDISFGAYGLLIAIPMFWYSRGDMDMLMISGTFITLHLLPYNMLPFVPAIARLRPRIAIIACLLSWLPLTANWLGPWGWWLGWLFVAWLWGALAWERYRAPASLEQKSSI